MTLGIIRIEPDRLAITRDAFVDLAGLCQSKPKRDVVVCIFGPEPDRLAERSDGFFILSLS